MKHSLKYGLIVILMIFGISKSFAENDKDMVYNKLIEKYGDLSSVTLKFKSMDNDRIDGTIEAKKGNKYLIRMANRLIVCNAKSIWNYSIDDNNVIVSKFDKDLHSNSIEKLFFSLLQSFTPTAMKKESSSKGTSFTVLTLKSDEKENAMNIKQIKLWLDKNYNIESFSFLKDGNEERWAVWDIFTNTKIQDKTFDFKVPKGAEVIDLR